MYSSMLSQCWPESTFHTLLFDNSKHIVQLLLIAQWDCCKLTAHRTCSIFHYSKHAQSIAFRFNAYLIFNLLFKRGEGFA